MPKKRMTAPDVELEQVPTEAPSEQDTESQEYELSQFIAENSESANFATVYKKSSTGQFERIGKYALTACDLDTIAQEYGGGVFRVRITTETGQFIKQFTTTYASPKPKPENKGGDTQGLMNILISQNQQNQQMLLKAIEVLGTRPQPTPTTELKPTDIIQMMTAVKSLTSSGDNATETLLRGLEMGLSLGEKSSEGLSTVDRIVEAIPTLATALQTRKTALRNEVRKLAVKPNPTETPALATVESEKPEEVKPMTPKSPVEARIFALLTNVRPHVQAAEKSGIPAAMLASYVSSNVDEDTARELLQYLDEKDASGAAVNISRLAQFLGIGESYMNELYIQVVYAVDTMFPHDGEREPDTESTGADVAGD